MFNWLSNLFVSFRQGRKLRPKVPHLEAVAVHNHTLWSTPADIIAHPRVYQQSPWVYIAINRIAEAAALVPMRVMNRSGEKLLEVERHPLERLLDVPNPYMSRFELFEQTIGMLELTGNAYWFLSGNTDGTPKEIWVLRPDRVSIVPDPQEYVRGYIYEIDGRRIPLDAVEVIHFKRWHPANDYYGLSALEAAQVVISSDRAMAEWNRNTFGKDNGVPAGVVNIKEFVSDSDFARMKREWKQSHGGTRRRTAFLRGGEIEWQSIGLRHTDLDFLKGREAHRNEILNIFGIPVGLVSENSTEANAKVAERLFIERTLYPKLVRLAQKITQELLPFYPGETVAEFEDIRPTDTQARLDEIRTSYPVMSVNEIRERYYQLPSVAWGTLPVGQQESVGAQRDVPANSKSTPTGDCGDQPEAESSESAKSALDELAQWERFAMKRIGKKAGRAFEVAMLPDELAFEVSARLLVAGDKEAVRSIFQSARDGLLEGEVA